jgi:hypothetical protein
MGAYGWARLQFRHSGNGIGTSRADVTARGLRLAPVAIKRGVMDDREIHHKTCELERRIRARFPLYESAR